MLWVCMGGLAYVVKHIPNKPKHRYQREVLVKGALIKIKNKLLINLNIGIRINFGLLHSILDSPSALYEFSDLSWKDSLFQTTSW